MLLSNYLFFTTACEQALAFYTTCGLGKVTEMMRYGVDGMPAPTKAMQGKIMHARFEGPGVLSMRQTIMMPSPCVVRLTLS